MGEPMKMEKVRKALGGDGTPYTEALAEVEEWEARAVGDGIRISDLRRRAEAAEAGWERTILDFKAAEAKLASLDNEKEVSNEDEGTEA